MPTPDSLAPSLPVPRRLWDRRTAPLVLWIVAVSYLSLVPASIPTALDNDLFDQLVHVGMYALFGWLMAAWWAPRDVLRLVESLGLIALSTAWGWYIECLQALTPYRGYDMRDVAADCVGAACGVALFGFWRRRRAPELRAAPMLLAFLFVAWTSGCARETSGKIPAPFNPQYPEWSALLARHASAEGVDYATIHQHPELLDAALSAMAQATKAQFDRWPPRARLAFLVNAHNAFAVDRIVRRYPVARIEGTRWFGSARGQTSIRLLGRTWSLRDLEEEVMSDRFLDARAIFLLNWAEAGCAPLPSAAATETNIADLLERQTRVVLTDPRYCEYDDKLAVIKLTPLPDLWREEFKRDYATLWEFLKKYMPAKQAGKIAQRPPRIRWIDFDKSLNDANAGK